MATNNGKLNKMTFDNSFARLHGTPLDAYELFTSLAAAQAYAQTHDAAYVGQTIKVVNAEAGTVTSYNIQNAAGDLAEVGSATLGDEKSIELVDGVLSLKNFGKKYMKYQEPTEEGQPGTYVETEGWANGLEPKVRMISEGVFELAWYQPNPTTVEGLQSAISDLQGAVADMYHKGDVYNKSEIDAKLSEIPQWMDL